MSEKFFLSVDLLNEAKIVYQIKILHQIIMQKMERSFYFGVRFQTKKLKILEQNKSPDLMIKDILISNIQ